jgi:hypothetical protein
MTQTTTILTEIVAHLLGRKYYANILHTRGSKRCEISSYIFVSKADAIAHKESLETNQSYAYVETVSFRSRVEYSNLTTFSR